MLVDLGVGMPINESLARYAGSLDALDAEFAEYAREQAEAMAPEADWAEPELPRRATQRHDRGLAEGSSEELRRRWRAWPSSSSPKEKWEAAKAPLEEMQKLYPADESGERIRTRCWRRCIAS